MTFTSWEQAVAALVRASAAPTAEQLALAEKLGISNLDLLPPGVVAELLRTAVREPLALPTSDAPSDGQLEYVYDLCAAVQLPVPSPDLLATKALVSAWIDAMHARRAISALQKLKPEPGDVVADVHDSCKRGEVSSISADGRLNYRGGEGAGGRPHQLAIVARASDTSETAAAARKSTRNSALGRRVLRRAEAPTLPQMAQIEQWLVKSTPERADIQELEAALEAATDEKPLQKVLTAHPALLGVLLGGTAGNAVWPWPRLDGRFIPDFMLAEANSAGIHWTLVELESPRARMLLPDGRLADKAREGVSQIRAWRDYLADQIAHARAPRHENGLGLVGIRPHRARGIVLIGRREDTIELPTHERLSLANESLILIHSYDWLIDQLGGGTHPGPWAPLNRELRAAGVDLNDIAWN